MNGWVSKIGGSAVPYAALAVAFRLFCIFRYRVTSDEPQHLHIAWLWSQGLVGYRDFYDNHTPLFHLLFAPFVGAIGETPHILLLGRFLMVPLAIVSVWLFYRIALHAHGRTIATWTTIASLIVPTFLFRTTEFRNDNLWVVWTYALLAIAVASPLTVRRAAILGLIVGLSVLTSIKTVFVAAALGFVLLIVDRPTLRMALAAIGGFLAPLAVTALWFYRLDALEELYRCTYWINSQLEVVPVRRIIGVSWIVTSTALAFFWLRKSKATRAQKIVVAATVLFISYSVSWLPIVSPRDLLPGAPMLVLFFFALIPASLPLYRFLVLFFIPWAIFIGRLWEPYAYHEAVIQEAQKLTRPSERVLDLKGETVFRRRPSYLALEVAARNLIERGLAPDTFVEDLIRNRCYVATRDDRRFPQRTREFLNEHFLHVGVLRVAGSEVRNGQFVIAVPGPYGIVGDGPLQSRWYEPGVHQAPAGARYVLWAPAIERGFSVTR